MVKNYSQNQTDEQQVLTTSVYFSAYLRGVLLWRKYGHVCAYRYAALGDVAAGLQLL